MGSSYNVRVPFATMGQSVGRQIAEKKDRGFVANMQRLNKAISPHIMQGRKQRFSERMQEDAQLHDIAMKEKEVDNWKAMQEEKFSYDLRLYEETKRRDEAAAQERGTAWASLSEAMQEDPSIRGDYGRMSEIMGREGQAMQPSDLNAFLAAEEGGRDRTRFQNEQEEWAHKSKVFAFELEQSRARMEQARLTTQGMMAYTPAEKAALAKQLDEMKVFDALGASGPKYRKQLAEAQTAEQAAKVQEIILSNAKRNADLKHDTLKIKNSTARITNTLRQSEAERGEMEWHAGRADKAVARATGAVEHYDEISNDVLSKLQGVEKDDTDPIYNTQLKTLKEFVKLRNKNSKKYLGDQYYVNDDGDTVTIDIDAKKTAAVAKTRDIIVSMTPLAASAEKNAEALLSALDLDVADTQFLYVVPDTLIQMGYDGEYINRVMKYYKTEKDRILTKRRAEETSKADAAAQLTPTTTGDMGSEEEMEERKKKGFQGQLPRLGEWLKSGAPSGGGEGFLKWPDTDRGGGGA